MHSILRSKSENRDENRVRATRDERFLYKNREDGGHPTLITSSSSSSSSIDDYDDLKSDGSDKYQNRARNHSWDSNRQERVILRRGGEVEVMNCQDRARKLDEDVALRSKSHYFKGCVWRKQGIGQNI